MDGFHTELCDWGLPATPFDSVPVVLPILVGLCEHGHFPDYRDDALQAPFDSAVAVHGKDKAARGSNRLSATTIIDSTLQMCDFLKSEVIDLVIVGYQSD
eukprot:scaffold3621_cov114-Cylindrotheca_fusiformis.AAC.1